MQYIITRHYKMGNSNLTQSHIKSYDYLLISIQLVNEIFRSKNFYSKYGYSTAFKYEPESFWSRLVPKLFWTSGSVHAIYYNDELKEGTTFEVVDQPLFLPKTAKVFEVKLLNIWKFEELVRLIKDSKLLANRKEVLNEEIKEKAIETTRGESSCVICDDNKEDIVLLCSHAFCEACIIQWRIKEDSCPICRKELGEFNEFMSGFWNLVDTEEIKGEHKKLLDLALELLAKEDGDRNLLKAYNAGLIK
eukprot:TRINITY_DN669_c0_g2_i5.p1 TRINITY_DN669_c0_g2~~TRINITY_DN669_c0_g2_i5.p1  ORF type:complete len:248 (+),score=49.59 TRINITY_DN669_c0_g2_i5:36-779(+)